jgi:hypothetical protein
MKIQKFKISNLKWKVGPYQQDDFDECQSSGSIKSNYIVDLAEDEIPDEVIPQLIAQQSGWTPTSWTATPYQKPS